MIEGLRFDVNCRKAQYDILFQADVPKRKWEVPPVPNKCILIYRSAILEKTLHIAYSCMVILGSRGPGI